MDKIGGGGLLIVGLFLIFVGILISSDIFARLLDVLGFVVIIGGAIAGIIGLIKVFSGGGNRTSDF